MSALLLRFLLGMAVSIAAAAVLLPVAVVIARLLGRLVDTPPVSVFFRHVGADRLSVDLGDKVETAIVGGLVGGIVFASLSPALAPAMYDFHVQSGIVDRPEPELDVHRVTHLNDSDLQQFDVPPGENYSMYVVELHNDDRRVLSDYNLNVKFPGCVAASAMGPTNVGTAVVSNQTDRIQVGEFANRSANSTCYGAVQMDEFATSSSAFVTFVVDRSPARNRTRLYPEPGDGTVLMTSSYSWEYNSRNYYEPATLTAESVDTVDHTTV